MSIGGCLLTTLAGTCVAQAQVPARHVSLSVAAGAPAGCPDDSALRRAVDSVLGRSATAVAGAPEAAATIEVSFASSATRQQARLVLRGRDGTVAGTREVSRRGRSCAILEGHVAVVAALLVDVASETVQLEVPPPSAPEALEVLPVEASAPPAAAGSAAAPGSAEAPATPWRAQTAVAAVGLLGLLPGLAPGVATDLRARRQGWPWAVARLTFWPGTSTSAPGPGGTFVAGTLGAGLCTDLVRRESLGFETCGLLVGGLMQATGRGGTTSLEARPALALVEADLGLRRRLVGPLWVRGLLGATTGHRPDSFRFDTPTGSQAVHRPWPVALVGSLGLVFETSSEKGPPPGHLSAHAP